MRITEAVFMAGPPLYVKSTQVSFIYSPKSQTIMPHSASVGFILVAVRSVTQPHPSLPLTLVR